MHCTSSEKMTKSLIESPCNHSRQWWRCCWLQGDTESMWPRASTERPSFSSQALLRMLTCSKQKCINPFCTLSQTLNTDFQVFSNQHFEASFFFFFFPQMSLECDVAMFLDWFSDVQTVPTNFFWKIALGFEIEMELDLFWPANSSSGCWDIQRKLTLNLACSLALFT